MEYCRKRIESVTSWEMAQPQLRRTDERRIGVEEMTDVYDVKDVRWSPVLNDIEVNSRIKI